MRAKVLSIFAFAVVACDTPVQKVTLEPATVELSGKGATQVVVAHPVATTGAPMSAASANWTVADPKVATVEGEGKLTAVHSGKTTLSATVGKVTVTAPVTVEIPSKLQLEPTAVELLGEEKTATLTVQVIDDAGKAIANPFVFWKSSNENVVTVQDGKLTSVGAGTAQITCRHADVSATAQVVVKVFVIAKLAVVPPKVSVKVKKTSRLSIKALNPSGKKVEDAPVEWKSSNPAIATVGPDGVVTGVKKGKAKILVVVGGKKASADVAVK